MTLGIAADTTAMHKYLAKIGGVTIRLMVGLPQRSIGSEYPKTAPIMVHLTAPESIDEELVGSFYVGLGDMWLFAQTLPEGLKWQRKQ